MLSLPSNSHTACIFLLSLGGVADFFVLNVVLPQITLLILCIIQDYLKIHTNRWFFKTIQGCFNSEVKMFIQAHEDQVFDDVLPPE